MVAMVAVAFLFFPTGHEVWAQEEVREVLALQVFQGQG
jgi:hypothetical protein